MQKTEPLADVDLTQISLHELLSKEELPTHVLLDQYQNDRQDIMDNIRHLRFLDPNLTPAQQHSNFQNATQDVKRLKNLQQCAEQAFLTEILQPSIIHILYSGIC